MIFYFASFYISFLFLFSVLPVFIYFLFRYLLPTSFFSQVRESQDPSAPENSIDIVTNEKVRTYAHTALHSSQSHCSNHSYTLSLSLIFHFPSPKFIHLVTHNFSAAITLIISFSSILYLSLDHDNGSGGRSGFQLMARRAFRHS